MAFTIFVILQILDLITTLWFTHFGLREGNPLVLWLTHFAPNFTAGLFLIKAWAIGMGWIAKRAGHPMFFYITNPLFAFVVLWNMYWILFLRAW